MNVDNLVGELSNVLRKIRIGITILLIATGLTIIKVGFTSGIQLLITNLFWYLVLTTITESLYVNKIYRSQSFIYLKMTWFVLTSKRKYIGLMKHRIPFVMWFTHRLYLIQIIHTEDYFSSKRKVSRILVLTNEKISDNTQLIIEHTEDELKYCTTLFNEEL